MTSPERVDGSSDDRPPPSDLESLSADLNPKRGPALRSECTPNPNPWRLLRAPDSSCAQQPGPHVWVSGLAQLPDESRARAARQVRGRCIVLHYVVLHCVECPGVRRLPPAFPFK